MFIHAGFGPGRSDPLLLHHPRPREPEGRGIPITKNKMLGNQFQRPVYNFLIWLKHDLLLDPSC